MSEAKMNKAISKTRLILAPVTISAFLLTTPAYAAAPGITGPNFSLTAQAEFLTQPDGTAVVATALRENEGPFVIEVCWRRFDGIVLTTARVRRGVR